jgi:hypothetical protein
VHHTKKTNSDAMLCSVLSQRRSEGLSTDLQRDGVLDLSDISKQLSYGRI